MKGKTLILLVTIITLIKSDDPKPQAWAPKWKSTFTETLKYPFLGTKDTKGTWFYDYNTKQFRVDRESGLRDTYCGLIFPLSSTKCNQIVTKGARYLHFPDKKYCCKCCLSEHGCGVLKPEWVEKGVFVKTDSDDKGTYSVFNVKGFMNNVYEVYSSPLKEPRRIFQNPRSDMVFDKDSYTTNFDGEVFKLPEDSGDCEVKCPLLSFCTLAKFLG